MEIVKVSQEAKPHCLKSVCDCEVSFKIHLMKLMHTFLHTLFPLYSDTCMAVSEAAPYQFQQFLGLAYGKQTKTNKKTPKTPSSEEWCGKNAKGGGNLFCFIISISTIKWTPSMARNRQGKGALCSRVLRTPGISDMIIQLGWGKWICGMAVFSCALTLITAHLEFLASHSTSNCHQRSPKSTSSLQ